MLHFKSPYQSEVCQEAPFLNVAAWRTLMVPEKELGGQGRPWHQVWPCLTLGKIPRHLLIWYMYHNNACMTCNIICNTNVTYNIHVLCNIKIYYISFAMCIMYNHITYKIYIFSRSKIHVKFKIHIMLHGTIRFYSCN